MIPETVFGLPVHPLVVHAPVVLIPLTALGLVAVAVVPRWRRPYGPLVAAGSVAAFFSALAARLTGEAFEESLDLGSPVAEKVEIHEQLGQMLPWFVLVQAVLAVALVLVDRRGAGRAVVLTVAVLAVVAAGAATVQVVRTGHAGSEAVWNPTG